MARKKLSPKQKKAVWSNGGPWPKDSTRVKPIHMPYKGLVEEQDLLAPSQEERWKAERGDHVSRDLLGKRVKP